MLRALLEQDVRLGAVENSIARGSDLFLAHGAVKLSVIYRMCIVRTYQYCRKLAAMVACVRLEDSWDDTRL
jgi:hypothetical protein